MIGEAVAAAASLVSGARVHWYCDPRSRRPRIYFGNHSSHLDFVVIWSALYPEVRRRVKPVAGSDYWGRTPIRRYVADRVFRAVLIERSHGAHGADAARASIARMARELDRRESLIVFPEGTRSLDGRVGAFKSGLFHLSRLRPDVELIPVYLENLNRVLPKGEVLPVPMLSRVVFGPPLAPVPGEDKCTFLARARDSLIQLRMDS